MDIIILIAVFALLTGTAVFFSRLLHLNPGEGMVLATLVFILMGFLAAGPIGNYLVALIPIVILTIGGICLAGYRWIKDEKVRFDFLLSPYFIALTCVFLVSLFIYRGDVIQNIEELNLWAMADKCICQYDQLYSVNGSVYVQGSSFFRYIFLRAGGFQEGSLYAVSGLLYWIGLLLPFGGLKKDKSPRLLLYILLLHVGLYSMYYFGSKSSSPELTLACWTGGLSGWWITREKKKTDPAILIAGLLVAFTFTESFDVVMILFVPALVLTQLAGDYIKKKEFSERHKHLDSCIIAGLAALAMVIIILYANIRPFIYLKDNMNSFLKCLVENNMTLSKSDLNYTFIFNAVLFAVLLLAVINQKEQRQQAFRYIIYSVAVSAVYMPILLFNLVDAEVHVEEEYMIIIQRYMAILVIYLFVIAISWLLCQQRLLERKAAYIPGLILLVIFLYGVNADYITNTTAAYPEKSPYYASIQEVRRECSYIQDYISEEKKIYMINQGDVIASAEARFMLGDQVSNYQKESWQFSVSGGMVADQPAPYDSLTSLPASLTRGKYSYVWLHKTDHYLGTNLPKIMGDEMEENSEKTDSSKDVQTGIQTTNSQKINGKNTLSELVSSAQITGGQMYKVLYSKKKAKGLKLYKNIVPYETRKEYYLWNDIVAE